MYNGGGEFDGSSSPFTLDLSSQTYLPSQTSSFGGNGFYLPMDGNSPIGQDKSGNGNDWTPVNFGGSVALDNPQVSGARPILNTTQGGTQATVGYFGSRENKNITVTVAGKTGGGNAYFFDGVERDSLALLRGTTIIFDTTDSSNNSHPFKLSSTNADSSGGTEYTDGVAYFVNGGQKNGTDYVNQYSSHSSGFRGIKWTVPHNVSTTYYYCTVHNGMGEGGTLTSTTDETKADPYAWKTVLALPLVGDANDISNQINLTSSGKSITVSGASADSSESNFYSGSFVFDGSNDQISSNASSDFDFGSGDFTIETWMNMDSISAGQAILEYSGQSSSSAPDGQWYFSTSTGWQWFHNSTNYAVIAKAKVPTDKWIHLALVREGDVITHYLNGVCEASEAYTRTDAGSSSRVLIIGQQNSSSYFDGHLQDYRIYKGVAKYSGTTVGTQYFVPASTNPDILPDTPSGVAGGSKLTKITEGAVAFDGSNDNLTIAAHNDLDLSSGDFTVEGFVYPRRSCKNNHLLLIGIMVVSSKYKCPLLELCKHLGHHILLVTMLLLALLQ